MSANANRFCLTFVIASLFAAMCVAQGTERVLYSFQGKTDGGFPEGGVVIDPAGNLYGTTSAGGFFKCPGASDGCGVVFQLSPNGDGTYTEHVLADFDQTNGAYPSAGLILDPLGNLFGTSQVGQPEGTAFELTQTAGVFSFKVIARFGTVVGGGIPGDALVLDAAGNLFGTTRGGGAGASGVIYELSPNGSGGYTLVGLVSIGPNDDGGVINQAPLTIDAQGNLLGTFYGTSTGQGPIPDGAVFKLSPGAAAVTILHKFRGGADGCHPLSGLTLDNLGNLYGTTSGCGADPGAAGTVFRLSPNPDGSYTETTLHSFDGSAPGLGPVSAPVFDQSGNLFGTAGGGHGVVYELTPVAQGPWVYSIVYSFAGRPDGSGPSGLTIDANGVLCGTTMDGGTFGHGTVFAVTP